MEETEYSPDIDVSEVIYTLQLEHQKYYVGKTKDLSKRIDDHIDGNGSVWTRHHPFLKTLSAESITHSFQELTTTLKLMEKYGIDNVRGDIFSNLFLSIEDRRFIEKLLRSEQNLCYECGISGHVIKECPQLIKRNTFLKPDSRQSAHHH